MKKHPRFSWRATGHRLRVTRLALGLTEQQAAGDCGVSMRTYQKYESGHPQRGTSAMLKFVQKHDVSLDWLFNGEAEWIGRHLAQNAKGQVVILPAAGPHHRQMPRVGIRQ